MNAFLPGSSPIDNRASVSKLLLIQREEKRGPLSDATLRASCSPRQWNGPNVEFITLDALVWIGFIGAS